MRRQPFVLSSCCAVAVALLALGSTARTRQQPPLPAPEEPFRVEVQVVNVYCTVKEKSGALVTNLTREEFEVREDGKPQTIRYFAQETDRPVTLALLIDTSISQQHILPIQQQTAARFLERILRPVDLALLITFDVNVDLLQDFTGEAGRLERALGRARINAPQPAGPFPRRRTSGTRLFDALYLASAEKLAAEVGRKVIVVLSDGVDAGSTLRLTNALEAAQRSDTMIYALLVSDPAWYLERGMAHPGQGDLPTLTRETGGRLIVVHEADKPESLDAAFDAIGLELRSQYSLGYTPTNRRLDGAFRKIEVKVKRKGLRVQARRGYYAPRAPTGTGN